ncbi:hypothetical protein J4221_05090 [Candidatus Pacearchaeota archaeon]|nr:hypothetical protein [Candidatus Pacearchaeota archaeon]
MVKRDKRLEKGIESLKKEIEEHFERLDKDIIEKDEILARYHIKEIDKSLITALEHKLSLLGINDKDLGIIKKYKSRLEEYKRKLSMTNCEDSCFYFILNAPTG